MSFEPDVAANNWFYKNNPFVVVFIWVIEKESKGARRRAPAKNFLAEKHTYRRSSARGWCRTGRVKVGNFYTIAVSRSVISGFKAKKFDKRRILPARRSAANMRFLW